MKYSIKQIQNPLNREEKKFYAVPAWESEVDVRTLSNSISKMCTLTPIDVMAVLESFIQVMPDYLMAGNSVRLGDFGTFKLSFCSKGHQEKDDVSADDVKKYRVLFRAGSLLKQTLKNVKYTKK